jgi:hypothetical protein
MDILHQETLRRLFNALDEIKDRERTIRIVTEERDAAIEKLNSYGPPTAASESGIEDRYVNAIRITPEMQQTIRDWKFAVEYLYNMWPDNVATPGFSAPGSNTSIKIKLIKCVRKAWDFGLKDSKDIVEYVMGL